MVAAGVVSALVATRPTVAQVWDWLNAIPDPEVPAVSIVDLGIVRDVAWSEATSSQCIVTVTPTYSGCPATEVIGRQIREKLGAHGIEEVDLRIQLAPAWTTDWLTEAAHAKLSNYGIAPPVGRAKPMDFPKSVPFVVLNRTEPTEPVCPRCGSARTEVISRFGSTLCKSLHRCLSCLEPFDHFKCH